MEARLLNRMFKGHQPLAHRLESNSHLQRSMGEHALLNRPGAEDHLRSTPPDGEPEAPPQPDPSPPTAVILSPEGIARQNVAKQRSTMQRYMSDFFVEAKYLVFMVLLLVSVLMMQKSLSFLFNFYLHRDFLQDEVQIAWSQLACAIYIIMFVIVVAIVWQNEPADEGH